MIVAVSRLWSDQITKPLSQDKILSEQAERERDDPLLPTVEPILEGKELFTCQMAADDFRKILGIMGGPGEKARGEKLLASLTIVPDAPSTRSTALKESASIKSRAKVIFGTADSLKVSDVIFFSRRGLPLLGWPMRFPQMWETREHKRANP